mgnify:CR=1 FL=1
MVTLLVILHILISVTLIMVVLLQSAKGEGLAGAFGGGSGITGAVFGGRGAASFLSKATSVLAVAFFLSCIVLSVIVPSGAAKRSSAIQEEARKQPGPPVVPQTQAAPAQGQTQGQQGQTGTGQMVLPPAPKDTTK